MNIQCITVLLYQIFASEPDNISWYIKLGSGIVIYYFFAIIIYIVFAIGICMSVLKAYHVNYPFIFELGPKMSKIAPL